MNTFITTYLLCESFTLVTQSWPALCDPMDCSLPGSSVHGILQARILEWVAISFSRGSSRPRDQTWVSWIAGGLLIIVWANREANESFIYYTNIMQISFKLNIYFSEEEIIRRSHQFLNHKHCLDYIAEQLTHTTVYQQCMENRNYKITNLTVERI